MIISARHSQQTVREPNRTRGRHETLRYLLRAVTSASPRQCWYRCLLPLSQKGLALCEILIVGRFSAYSRRPQPASFPHLFPTSTGSCLSTSNTPVGPYTMDLITTDFVTSFVAASGSFCSIPRQLRIRTKWQTASTSGFGHSHDSLTRILLFLSSCVRTILSLSHASALARFAPAAQSCPPIVSILLRHSASSFHVWRKIRTHAIVDLLQSNPRTSCQITGCTCVQKGVR